MLCQYSDLTTSRRLVACCRFISLHHPRDLHKHRLRPKSEVRTASGFLAWGHHTYGRPRGAARRLTCLLGPGRPASSQSAGSSPARRTSRKSRRAAVGPGRSCRAKLAYAQNLHPDHHGDGPIERRSRSSAQTTTAARLILLRAHRRATLSSFSVHTAARTWSKLTACCAASERGCRFATPSARADRHLRCSCIIRTGQFRNG